MKKIEKRLTITLQGSKFYLRMLAGKQNLQRKTTQKLKL